MYVAGFIIQEAISSFYIIFMKQVAQFKILAQKLVLLYFFLNSSDNHSPIADPISQPRRLVRNY